MFDKKIINNTIVIYQQRCSHDPICQRCEKRFSSCKCKSGFVSTGSLMLPEKTSSEASAI